MNAHHNPMTVQMWLWGLDALRGDLAARGFVKLERPNNTDSSIYCLDDLFLHGFAVWIRLPDEVLFYHRPRKAWYNLPHSASFCLQHLGNGGLAWCDFARPQPIHSRLALERFRPVVLEHEQWLEQRHTGLRQQQLAGIGSKPVRRAKKAWLEWVDPNTAPNGGLTQPLTLS
jgi:hypothetical protein